MSKQPEALRLAESISRMDTFTEHQRSEMLHAAAELRRLHEANAELLEVLKEMVSITAIHQRATKNNFAWAEMADARAAIAKHGGQ